MEEKDVLRVALEMLDWTPDDLETELNREVTAEGQRVSRSTIYRWLAGTSPTNAGVKAFLREKISALGNFHPVAPRELTKVLVMGPGGSGVTPLVYEIGGCVRKAGIGVAIVEPKGDRSLWHGIAMGEHVGFDIAGFEPGAHHELIFEERKDIRDSFNLPEKRKGAQTAIKGYDGLLIIGEGIDMRMNAYVDMCRFAKEAGLAVAAIASIRPQFGVPSRLWNDFADMDVETAVFIKPSSRTGMDLFKRCLNPNVGREDPLTDQIWSIAYWLLEALGWPDGVIEDTGNSGSDYTLSLSQIVRSHRLSHRGGRIPRFGN
jgi:hypothetical protein